MFEQRNNRIREAESRERQPAARQVRYGINGGVKFVGMEAKAAHKNKFDVETR